MVSHARHDLYANSMRKPLYDDGNDADGDDNADADAGAGAYAYADAWTSPNVRQARLPDEVGIAGPP